MPKLTKSQVERLVDEVASAGDDGAANRRAVACALALALGDPVTGEPSGPGLEAAHWRDLVHRAASLADWAPARTAALLDAAAEPGRRSVLDALWDLAAELNERRDLVAPR